MKQLAIKAENISKQYRLGEVGTGTLSHDLNRFWSKIRGKEDPYLKIGDSNDRTSTGASDYVWSLKDINFEVQQGDAVGIIGRNGAGKSTLLKLLSKVTKPTTGNFKVNGRIASLLEVGTGFNPEMTGRENIYMNGAILGMRRHEITRKFDEIVAFAGVEKYIDTPVKRYSSGMYVRLAFAVAAHLESEILIVDEVLAVGDAEFQKKCLGKMGDVSKGEGRTVLFVSHNMVAVNSLCNNGIVLNNGKINYNGGIMGAVENYSFLGQNLLETDLFSRKDRMGTGKIKFSSINFFDLANNEITNIQTGMSLIIKCYFKNNIDQDALESVRFDLNILDQNEVLLTQLTSFSQQENFVINADSTHFTITIPKLNLLEGKYIVSLYAKINEDEADWINNAVSFYIEAGDYYNVGKVMPKGFGFVALDHSLKLN
ncbi:ABC transporter ATP-binding protein [Flavobacterium sp.]|uniref:ABC transporter ATP-binding protein n=1 Tax=Flavobacterium sp. TaxID=239 RepID=UPI00260D1613|nr:ABC transporter ATP-binding protein [Flavobacterium sp.]MDG2432909.1 ABC transporter ATP-binding protein [Flavobacterium sp.]